jgi:hypothetical protein
MVRHRTAHYSLVFLFLGVIAASGSLFAKAGLSPESIWFLVTGLIGVVVNRINRGALVRPYDLMVGSVFTLVGLVGILLQFKLNLLTSTGLAHTRLVGTTTDGHPELVGLDLSFFPALVYAFLGLTSLNHGLKSK